MNKGRKKEGGRKGEGSKTSKLPLSTFASMNTYAFMLSREGEEGVACMCVCIINSEYALNLCTTLSSN